MKTFEEVAAESICSTSLNTVRKCEHRNIPDWIEGRVTAAEFIVSTPATVAAKNEIMFLIRDYWPRHQGIHQ